MRLFSVKSTSTATSKGKRHTGRKILIITGVMMVLFMAAPMANNNVIDTMTGTVTSYAAESATFSQYWFQDSNGTWKVRDGSGNIVKNAWLCDDAVTSNGLDVWYLLDGNGNMVSAGLVQDQTGNFYSLETNHNGYYGMLRYKSGSYDGVNLSLESSHGGAFAAVLNADGVENLKAKYGVTTVNIDNSNCVYTSSFATGGGSGSSGNSSGSQQQQAPQQSTSTGNSTADRYAELLKSGQSISGGTVDVVGADADIMVGDTSGYENMLK